MSAESQLYDRMTGYAGLSALVSTRVYPVLMPQDVTLPAVTFTRISSTRPTAFGSDAGKVRARFQVEAWSDQAMGSASGADTVGEQVRQALQRYRSTSGSPTIHDIFIENQFEDYEPETRIHRMIFDAIVWYGNKKCHH